MAITVKNVYIDSTSLNAGKIPSGNTVLTAAAAIGTARITETVDFTIAFSDFVAATTAAGFDDLLKVELVADIDAYVAAAAGLGVDITSNPVKYNAKVTNVAIDALSNLYANDANRNIVVTTVLSVAIS